MIESLATAHCVPMVNGSSGGGEQEANKQMFWCRVSQRLWCFFTLVLSGAPPCSGHSNHNL